MSDNTELQDRSRNCLLKTIIIETSVMLQYNKHYNDALLMFCYVVEFVLVVKHNRSTFKHNNRNFKA